MLPTPVLYNMLKKIKTEMCEQIILGDCLAVLKTLPDNSIDSIITDPPYGLSEQPDIVEIMSHWVKGEYVSPNFSGGFMGHSWDSFVPAPDIWKECFRVLKPGGTALVFAGSRTQDLMTVSLRFGGFQIIDTFMWLFGSGTPHAIDISDKLRQSNKEELADLFEGWKTKNVKPAYNPIVLASKPNDGTYMANAIKWGVSGFCINGCLVPLTTEDRSQVRTLNQSKKKEINGWGMNQNSERIAQVVKPEGRFPSNVIHDGSVEVINIFPKTKSGKMKSGTVRKNRSGYAGDMPEKTGKETIGDSGSASRFFYCARASKKEKGINNSHPTVKPLSLIKYLCNLTKTPTGGIVLDPFAGSGTTGLACRETGRPFILIEREKEYVDIIKKRLEE